MTDILFINTALKLELKQETNGTLLLATKLLEAGFQVQILRFAEISAKTSNYRNFIEEITGKILAMAPRCVSFYTLWPYYHIQLRIAAEVKKQNPAIITVMGGPQASATAEDTLQAMPFVDYVCAGEGENTVVPFFDAIFRQENPDLSQIPGLYYRENGKVTTGGLPIPRCDLDTLPYWDDRLLPVFDETPAQRQSKRYSMPIDVGRGCPFRCTFCCTSRFWNRMYRLKSPERIVEEIQYYQEKFGIRHFMFSHDAFTVNNKLVEKVCDYILEKKLDITWKCTSRIDCVSEELLLKMKQAGMRQIEFGVETGSERMQKEVKKNLDLSKVRSIASFLLKNGIEVGLFFMYGFPEETEEDLNQTLQLLFDVSDMGVQYLSMAYCRFNPTTPMTEQYFDQLVLDPEVKGLFRGMAGYEEELPMIRENKSIFPFYYHLHTPVRDEYHFAYQLMLVYHAYPKFARYLRQLYHGDNLKFYRDFVRCNRHILEQDMAHIMDKVNNHPLEMLHNILDSFDLPYISKIKELLRFEDDTYRVYRSDEDISLRETYGFSYVDFKLKLPIEQYSNGKTEILLERINGKKSLKLLNME